MERKWQIERKMECGIENRPESGMENGNESGTRNGMKIELENKMGIRKEIGMENQMKMNMVSRRISCICSVFQQSWFISTSVLGIIISEIRCDRTNQYIMCINQQDRRKIPNYIFLQKKIL